MRTGVQGVMSDADSLFALVHTPYCTRATDATAAAPQGHHFIVIARSGYVERLHTWAVCSTNGDVDRSADHGSSG